MSRIADDILSNLDIVDVVSRYVQLKKVGRNFVGLSPFRNERTPSFTVSPEKQIFKCFSTGIGGNAIKFIIEMEKIDFWDAVKILAPQANVDISKYEYNKNDKNESIGAEKEKYKLMLRTAQSYFTDNLKKSPSSQEYLHTKRHLSDEIIEKFGLGYAPDSHYGLTQLLSTKGFTDEDITGISLGKKGQTGDIYSFYRNRITFPIYDHLGTLVGFGARAINPEDNPKYLNSSDSILYDKSKILYGLHIAKNNIKLYDKLIVVEGYMDVIGLSRLGLDVGVATCGTSLTQQHMKLVKRYTQNLFFLFDSDPAGFDATVRGLKIAYEQDTYPKILSLPDGYKDVDEWANVSPDEEAMRTFFDGAEDGIMFVMKKLIEKYDHHSPIERKRIIEQLFSMLLYVQDLTMLTWYIEKIGGRLGIGQDVLLQQYKTFSKSQTMITKSIEKSKEEKPVTLDHDLLVASFFYDDFLKKMEVESQKVYDLLELSKELALATDDSLIVPILQNTLSSDQKESILEAQLYRERQREVHHKEKKEREVRDLCTKYINRAIQQINKLATVPLDKKQALNEKMRKLLMGK